jgi:hypothetical protein
VILEDFSVAPTLAGLEKLTDRHSALTTVRESGQMVLTASFATRGSRVQIPSPPLKALGVER